MTDTPLLALWRTKTAPALRRRPGLADQLVALVLRHTLSGSDEKRLAKLAPAKAGAALRTATHDALLALARELGGEAPHRSDAAMSLVLAAALEHSELACLALVQALVARAHQVDHRPLRRRRPSSNLPRISAASRFAARRHPPSRVQALRIALSWSREIQTSFLTQPEVWCRELSRLAALCSGLMHEPGDDKPPKPAPAHAGDGAPRPPGGSPSLTVVRAIGDPESADGETVARLYARLAEPLPLLGGETDPEVIAAALELEFPHLAGAIAPVLQDLRLRRRAGGRSAYLRPLLLLGPPGVGKTRLAKTLARLLDVGCGELSGAGSSDDRMLRGTARGWRNCQPALPLLVMLQSGCANPLMIVDELDKAGGSEGHGDIRHTLLSLLERETAQCWTDECLLAPCDLSQVSWICTANDIASLPGSLLSRLRIVRCPRPGPEAFDRLFESVLRDIALSLGIERAALPPLEPQVVAKLRRAFVRRGDVRALKRLVETALAAGPIAPRALH